MARKKSAQDRAIIETGVSPVAHSDFRAQLTRHGVSVPEDASVDELDRAVEKVRGKNRRPKKGDRYEDGVREAPRLGEQALENPGPRRPKAMDPAVLDTFPDTVRGRHVRAGRGLDPDPDIMN